MEINKKEIVEKSVGIIMNDGIDALTVNNLAKKLKINELELIPLFTNNEDILLLVFKSFEQDLKEFIQELSNQTDNKTIELNTFFKSLYNVFLQKPYYLSIIFDKRLKNNNNKIKSSILQMRKTIEDYLKNLIEYGKSNNTFKTKTSTRLLVTKILIEFRLLMKDEQNINEMIQDLELLRKTKE
ncbi:MAG TPA: hypothetical protein P5132_06270 [Bacteroidales bacterium]|nr:hypothetical protein [Bacteroidales bacterium]